MDEGKSETSGGLVLGTSEPVTEVIDGQEVEALGSGRHIALEEANLNLDKIKVELARGGNRDVFAAENWDVLGLKPALLQGLMARGYARPSKIQAKALPTILTPRPDAGLGLGTAAGGMSAEDLQVYENFIGQAKNGSGKTATFAVSILQRIDENEGALQAVVLAPTRELAIQNATAIEELGQFMSVKVHKAVAGSARWEDLNFAHIHVLSGTPGKVEDLVKIAQRQAGGEALRHLKIFVLDEADTMLEATTDRSMGKQVAQTALLLRKLSPTMQTLLFSATFPEHLRALAMQMATHANKLTVPEEQLAVENLKQTCICVRDESEKFEALIKLYESANVGQTVIFVNTIAIGTQLAHDLQAQNFAVTLLCGSGSTGSSSMGGGRGGGTFGLGVGGAGVKAGLTHEERDARMDQFRKGVTRVLVTTDVLARGIDVAQISLVINYELPLTRKKEVDMETYLHRIGRTGRFDRQGFALSLVTERERAYITAIENHYKIKILDIPPEYERISEIVNSLRSA